MEYYPACLCHHGVKGMKWGVRRKLKNKVRLVKRKLTSKTINRNAKKTKSTKKVSTAQSLVSEDHKKGHLSKPVNQMTNAELKAMVDRLTLENSYNEQRNKQRGKDATDRAIETLTKLSNAANVLDNLYTKGSKYYKQYQEKNQKK
uniref:Uncharacterized protein n=1 Tax=Siphoviridae sp. ctWWc42 TaxID=2826361 RepID=A0A8S5R2F3_9CAUD|nr:MAG TPA: hypothetical protein [Siphoviridae sp. ctWWc42]